MLLLTLLSFWFPSESSSLLETLHEQLTQGSTSFSSLEIALIASGMEDPEGLPEASAQLERFLEKLVPSEKQKEQSAAKQQRIILKNLGKALKKQVLAATLQDGMTLGEYNPITASFYFDQALTKAGLKGEAWPEEAEPAVTFFGSTPAQSTQQVLSSLLIQHAERLIELQPEKAALCLQISLLLQAEAPFEAENLAREWYNHSYRLYERKALLEGARVITASARRFPALQEFQALCFNFGILLIQDKELGFAQKKSLVEGLIPLAGENGATLADTYEALKFNQAITYYEAAQFVDAWELGSTIERAPDANALKSLKSSILENLIEEVASDGEPVDALLKQLADLDSERHQRIATRLKQIAVKSQYEQGNLDEALELASKQIDAENGRDNYIAVLQKITENLNAAQRFEEALKRLAATPKTHADPEQVANLRYNTYLAWLNHPKDPLTQFSIYKQVLTDQTLSLSSRERASLQEGMGNAYYLQIEKLIADREFAKAQVLSQEALRLNPDHANLIKQGQLIKTIMDRIKN